MFTIINFLWLDVHWVFTCKSNGNILRALQLLIFRFRSLWLSLLSSKFPFRQFKTSFKINTPVKKFTQWRWGCGSLWLGQGTLDRAVRVWVIVLCSWCPRHIWNSHSAPLHPGLKMGTGLLKILKSLLLSYLSRDWSIAVHHNTQNLWEEKKTSAGCVS